MKISKNNTGIVITKAFTNDEYKNIDCCIFYINKEFLIKCKETVDNIKDDFFSLEYFVRFSVEFFNVDESLENIINENFDWAFLDEDWYEKNKSLFIEADDSIMFSSIKFYKDGKVGYEIGYSQVFNKFYYSRNGRITSGETVSIPLDFFKFIIKPEYFGYDINGYKEVR